MLADPRVVARVRAVQASGVAGPALEGPSHPELVDLLAAAIVLARSCGVDAESALRGWAVRFRRRFEAMERLAEARQLELSALTPQAVAALWIESGGEP